jgi:pimeloyl-ACP methyl ester carboxylesterase
VPDRSLHHEIVTPAAGSHRAWLYVLPGIFGSGRNWATVARRLVAERPDWAAVLVDLREHGGSLGFPPPHTLAATAEDVHVLARATQRPIAAVLGHSFGGKVALQLAQIEPDLAQVWIVDSTPEPRPAGGSAWSMLATLRMLPASFASREQAIQALVAAGSDPATAQWMGTNLERFDGGVRWRFDLASLEALLQDFFRADLWPMVTDPPAEVQLHFVRATRSSVMAADTAMRIAGAGPRVHLHSIEGGHWLNADNPAGVVALLANELPAMA